MDKIKFQAIRKLDNVCVSWWESGRVTQDETIYTTQYDVKGFAFSSARTRMLSDLPKNYPYNPSEYYQPVGATNEQ